MSVQDNVRALWMPCRKLKRGCPCENPLLVNTLVVVSMMVVVFKNCLSYEDDAESGQEDRL